MKYTVPLLLLVAASAFAGVTVTSPANNSTDSSPVKFVASATTSCSKGVAAMGIYTAPYVLAYEVNGATLNTSLSLAPGTYDTVVQDWDNCGGSAKTPVTISVSTSSGVTVTSPTNNSSVSDPVKFVASATTSCSKGIAAMGIYTAPGVLAYVVNGPSLNTTLNLNSGTYNTVVQDWDNCGGYAKTPITIDVTGGSGIPASSHVFLLVEENHSFSQVIGNSSMPYLNSLASKYGLAMDYFANTHPSIGNYFMMTTGQIITKDDSYCGTISNDNIVSYLITAGKTWKSYAESLPYAGYTGCDTGYYVKRHNPFSYFTDVANSSTEKYNLVPFSQFPKDLANNQLPQFSFIVPNVNDDAHNGTLGQADYWLKTNIAPLISSSVFQKDGILIIVFDESVDTDTQGGGGHVAALVIGPKVLGGHKSTITYQHQNTLKTLMKALGLSSFPGAASTASPMSDFF